MNGKILSEKEITKLARQQRVRNGLNVHWARNKKLKICQLLPEDTFTVEEIDEALGEIDG